MSNVKNIIQNNETKKLKKRKELKMTSKGRQVIRPKKLLTTSSDEKWKTRKRLIKRKSVDMNEELYQLKSCAAQPNILRDITSSSNMQKSKICVQTQNDATHILARDNMDTSLSHNNRGKQLEIDTNLTLPNDFTELNSSNMSSNDHNIKQFVKYNPSDILSKKCTGQSSYMSYNNHSTKQNSKMVEQCGSMNELEENVSHDNETRVKTVPNILENCFTKSSNKNVQFINISHISEMDNCHSVSESVNDTENTRNNNHNKQTPHILDIEKILIVFQNPSQEFECRTTKSSFNDTSHNEIVQLLRQVVEQNTKILSDIKTKVVEQNTKILSDIKTLKEHHTLTMQNDLYNRPEGFPLKTVEEFKAVETDKNRLQVLLTYLKFIGGIKLREALSHFQKETMTDELTCKFTYWGRTKESLAFHNTQIAKVFFYAAKVCPNFKGPETKAEFKLEIMEVFRAAKQRQYLKCNKDKNIAATTSETEDICFEDIFSNHVDTESTNEIEMEDPDASDESDECD